MTSSPLLQVRNLQVHFPVQQRLFFDSRHWVRAVDEVSFEIAPGETLGLVGESGCGKTTLGRAVVRLQEPTSGEIVFDGRDITRLSGRSLRPLRRHFQIVFQDPYGSLDPRMTVENIVGEALDIHRLASNPQERRQRVAALLKDVGLDAAHALRFPHEFSGGQRQRIGIARALAVKPRLIVCDEPVSALDVSVQAQVVNLLKDLQLEHGLSYLFIAHDLAVVAHISNRIMVMYLGKMVEVGSAANVSGDPKHPYTKALIAAIPRIQQKSNPPAVSLRGDVASAIRVPSGCPFHTRCPVAEPRCKTEVPVLREVAPGHFVACHLAR